MVERLPPALGGYRSFEKPPCAYIYIYILHTLSSWNKAGSAYIPNAVDAWISPERPIAQNPRLQLPHKVSLGYRG